jgi:hypothetical protein
MLKIADLRNIDLQQTIGFHGLGYVGEKTEFELQSYTTGSIRTAYVRQGSQNLYNCV